MPIEGAVKITMLNKKNMVMNHGARSRAAR